jgi:hypothetical protein
MLLVYFKGRTLVYPPSGLVVFGFDCVDKEWTLYRLNNEDLLVTYRLSTERLDDFVSASPEFLKPLSEPSFPLWTYIGESDTEHGSSP